MDIDWIIEQNTRAYHEGHLSAREACNGILNVMAMSEQEVIGQYTRGLQAIKCICDSSNDESDKKMGEILVKMTKSVVADEGNHAASFNKASAICAGYDVPKPDEYNKAEK